MAAAVGLTEAVGLIGAVGLTEAVGLTGAVGLTDFFISEEDELLGSSNIENEIGGDAGASMDVFTGLADGLVGIALGRGIILESAGILAWDALEALGEVALGKTDTLVDALGENALGEDALGEDALGVDAFGALGEDALGEVTEALGEFMVSWV